MRLIVSARYMLDIIIIHTKGPTEVTSFVPSDSDLVLLTFLSETSHYSRGHKHPEPNYFIDFKVKIEKNSQGQNIPFAYSILSFLSFISLICSL